MAGYGDDSAFAAWMTENGYSLPVGAPTAVVLRQRGSTYIDGMYGERFPGKPTGGIEQERAWPRTGATIYGTALADSVIPQRVVDASYMAAYLEATSPGSLAVITDPAKRVKRQKVDTIEREFFDHGDLAPGTIAGPVASIVDGLLAPLLEPAPVGIGIWVV